MQPTVSIVIPTYNHASFVGHAIQSVLQQEYQDYEIIVVDDGSQDHTATVVAAFGEKVRYLWQENSGLSAARNRGIGAAKGKLIGLLDADDLYKPHFLSTLVPIIESHRDIDAIYCTCQFVDGENNPLFQKTEKIVPPAQLYNSLLNGNFIVPLCMLAHKYCYERVGLFDKNLQGCADWDMWLRMAKEYTILGVNHNLARYRVLPQSMSSDPIHMLHDRLRVLEKHQGVASNGSGQAQWQRAYARAYLKSLVEYLQIGSEEQAYACLQKIVHFWPKLLTEPSTLTEIGFGCQPKGLRGNFASLDMAESRRLLFSMLDRIFTDPQLSLTLQKHRKEIYAEAHITLGLLSYGAQDFALTRSMFMRAASFNLTRTLRRQVVSTFLKSLVGARYLHRLKSLRQAKLLVNTYSS